MVMSSPAALVTVEISESKIKQQKPNRRMAVSQVTVNSINVFKRMYLTVFQQQGVPQLSVFSSVLHAVKEARLNDLAVLALFNDVPVGFGLMSLDKTAQQLDIPRDSDCKDDNADLKPKVPYLMTLGVLAQYRRYGIGEMLVHHLIQAVKQLDGDYQNVYLHCRKDDERLQQWYSVKFGFKIESTVEGYYNGTNDAVVMRLSLKL